MLNEDEVRALFRESKLVQLVSTAENQSESMPADIPIDNIRRRVNALKSLRASCQSDDGWVLQKETHNVRTLYRNNQTHPHIHSIRLDGDVEAPVFILLALLHEVDMFSKWIPTYSFLGLNFARLISHPSPTELLVHINIHIPWPFTNRYCFFHCDGIDCMDDPDSPHIGVIMNNLTSETENGVTDDSVKTDFHPPSGVLLTPLGQGTTKVQVVVNLDPKIALVPDWLIDFAVRNLAFLIVLQFRKAVEIVKRDPEYQKRMADPENEFYAHVRRRITESLPQEAKFLPDYSGALLDSPGFATPDDSDDSRLDSI